MPKQVFYGNEYKPDFGILWPRNEVDGLTEEQIREQAAVRLQIEAAAKEDPVQFGWVLESWQEVMSEWSNYNKHMILGGNRATKTSLMARLVVDMALKIPECKIRCWHVNEEKSVAEQQALVWAAMPKRLKTLGKKRGQNFDINFSQKNGFAGSKVIFPPSPGYDRGSEIQFNFYQQYRVDSQVAEGWNAHLIWLDEEAPQKLFETLQYRIVDFNGRIVMTFTTLNGWTPLVADICARKKVLRKRYASLMKREIPVAEESLSRAGTRIYYFWTEDNPFIPTRQFLKDLKGRPEEERLARAYGVPTKANFVKFTKFDENVHVISHDKLPWLSSPEEDFGKSFTRYFGCDPAGGDKNWFMLWIACSRNKDVYVYREWPDETYGTWGEPSESVDGKRGPAQKPLGYTLSDYKDLILELERGEDVFERYVDPRLANTKMNVKDSAVTIITEMRELDMHLIPAPGVDIEQGEQRIIDIIGYDTTKPIDFTNRPKLYISNKCVNLIDAMKNYTGQSRDEVWKDPIDVLRYMLVAGASYVDNSGVVQTGKSFSY